MSAPIRPEKKSNETRRDFLRRTFQGVSALALAPALSHCGGSGGDFDYGTVPQTSNFGNLGELLPPDENGLRLPAGFTSRVVARSGQLVQGTAYTWHGSPDGAATYPLADGGYIYVSNSEMLIPGQGGAGAIRFDKNGRIKDAYRILENTRMNCGGGPTPWGTWMSGEEWSAGQIHECDPHGELPVAMQLLDDRVIIRILLKPAARVDHAGNAQSVQLAHEVPRRVELIGRIELRPHG